MASGRSHRTVRVWFCRISFSSIQHKLFIPELPKIFPLMSFSRLSPAALFTALDSISLATIKWMSWHRMKWMFVRIVRSWRRFERWEGKMGNVPSCKRRKMAEGPRWYVWWDASSFWWVPLPVYRLFDGMLLLTVGGLLVYRPEWCWLRTGKKERMSCWLDLFWSLRRMRRRAMFFNGTRYGDGDGDGDGWLIIYIIFNNSNRNWLYTIHDCSFNLELNM